MPWRVAKEKDKSRRRAELNRAQNRKKRTEEWKEHERGLSSDAYDKLKKSERWDDEDIPAPTPRDMTRKRRRFGERA